MQLQPFIIKQFALIKKIIDVEVCCPQNKSIAHFIMETSNTLEFFLQVSNFAADFTYSNLELNY